MSPEANEMAVKRPLRILTIDNGGLQAISILRVLKEVCKKLSKKDGHTTPLRPCELFDIIGGIGTGGWLAILLGRYRLRIDQCMSIYVTIANAIDPTRMRHHGVAIPGGAVALDQDILIEKIDKIVAEHKIGKYLVDEEANPLTDSASRQCHAFAVGVVKPAGLHADQEYRLFRSYQPSSTTTHQGPDPAKCKVSSACAATAAARDFLGEFNVDGLKYWDDTFPRTHNVSGLALDEATSLFGKEQGSNLDFVLNISPGVVSPDDVRQLQRTATMNSSKSSRHRWSPKWLQELPVCGRAKGATWPGADSKQRNTQRKDTSSSTSSDASEKELGHQKDIRKRLLSYAPASGRVDLYYRLELTAESKKPYLDDIAKPDIAMELAQEFLESNDTKRKLGQMIPEHSITGRPTTASPRESFASVAGFASLPESPLIQAH